MIVAVDLDGTLLDGDDWMPGALDALYWLAKRHQVVIHSCRANWHEGLMEIHRILAEAGLKHPHVVVHCAPGKPSADVYIDDRALQHRGDWGETIAKLCVRN